VPRGRENESPTVKTIQPGIETKREEKRELRDHPREWRPRISSLQHKEVLVEKVCSNKKGCILKQKEG